MNVMRHIKPSVTAALAAVIAIFILFSALPAAAYDIFSRDAGRSLEEIRLALQKRGAPAAPSSPANRLKVLAYNIQGAANFLKVDQLSKAVRAANADIVVLTECVGGNALYQDQAWNISKSCGYRHLAYKANVRVWCYFDWLGNAILSKTPLYDVKKVNLPKIYKESELRGIVAAKTRVNGREIAVIAAHFSRLMHPLERKKQAEFVADFAAANYPGIPVILAGDLNSAPADAVLAPLNAAMDEAFAVHSKARGLDARAGATIPSKNPDTKFDYIYFSKGRFGVANAAVHASTASDHRPFFAELEFK